MTPLRGILLMTAAMALFAVEDLLIKRLSAVMPTGQILAMLATAGVIAFTMLAHRRRVARFDASLWSRPVLLRNVGEVAGTAGFVTALSLVPLSVAAAILQATPLAVTLGGALFLGEHVGWRRWSAVIAGFVGVLLILRPGLAGFRPEALFAVLGVAGLAARDLGSRMTPRTVSSLTLSLYAQAMIVLLGLALMAAGQAPVAIGAGAWAQLLAAAVIGIGAYYAITEAMRLGDVSLIAPFRYTRLVFALILAVALLGERPDALTLLGAALVVGSGLYALARERMIAARTLSRPVR